MLLAAIFRVAIIGHLYGSCPRNDPRSFTMAENWFFGSVMKNMQTDQPGVQIAIIAFATFLAYRLC
jgi:hypothetical protein